MLVQLVPRGHSSVPLFEALLWSENVGKDRLTTMTDQPLLIMPYNATPKMYATTPF